ncbi:hypothetical protein [[Clostridium] colinum]|uniref:hypothetical protein n=1 Tax=[Clostridium] colinum TaxID=36835 RepID=UPI00202409D4|nr:hypothetical protein [[Clostridium] colinum]
MEIKLIGNEQEILELINSSPEEFYTKVIGVLEIKARKPYQNNFKKCKITLGLEYEEN